MAWRSVVITTPARLSIKNSCLLISQDDGDASVPVEDLAVLVLDCPQVVITSPVLSALADVGAALIVVDETHTPSGALLPLYPHYRAMGTMREQLGMSKPCKKRLWQSIVKQKLLNQAQVLRNRHQEDMAVRLKRFAEQVRSGDPDNLEAQGANVYFPWLFGRGFIRQNNHFYNSALNFSYAILRSAIARSLVIHGFLPAFGLHHISERNAFNLADDLIEPYRPLADSHVLSCFPEPLNQDLSVKDKASLVGVLNVDVPRIQGGTDTGVCSILAMIDATVISLKQHMRDNAVPLVMPKVP